MSESDMAGMLKLSNWEFKTTMVNMLRALIENVDSMQEQMGNVSRGMEILIHNQKEMLEIKITVKMKHALMSLLADWT